MFFTSPKLKPSSGDLNYEEEVIFRDNWRSKAPGKVLAFSWTLLLDRIPTKVNLAKRRLMGQKILSGVFFVSMKMNRRSFPSSRHDIKSLAGGDGVVECLLYHSPESFHSRFLLV
jgi:hypothetical protein